MTLKIQAIKHKMDKLDFIKLKIFILQMIAPRNLKDNTQNAKLFQNYIYDKELVMRTKNTHDKTVKRKII
jgi:hypothetical protein